MKTILTTVLVGGLLTTMALAQQPPRAFGRRGLVNNLEHRTAQTATPASPNLMAYVINVAFGFGAVDLRSGAFLPIGPGLPPDVGDGLIQGPGTSLLSLGFDGNLWVIDPFTGQASVAGATGLGDSANWIGLVDGNYYVTDFANNLYSLDPKTAATNMIGPTGIPPINFIPFNPDPNYPGSVDVFAEGLFSSHGKFYAYFSTQAVNFATGTVTNLIPGEIYQLDPATGQTTPVAPASSNFSAITTVHDTIYAFDAIFGQVDILDPTTGNSTPVSTLDPSAGIIAGATPAVPAAPAVH